MLFQNLWLLMGVMAVVIPIVIHLLNRQTARTVPWGAIQFLLDSIIQRKRRIMLEEALLLGARCLLLTLLAVAIARPFVPPDSTIPYAVLLPLMLLAVVMFGVSFALAPFPRSAVAFRIGGAALILLAALAIGFEKKLNLGRFGLTSSQSIAVVIDGSTSMTVSVDGKSNFERAVAEAGQIVETADRGADFSLVLAGPYPVTVIGAPVADRARVMTAIEDLKPVSGQARIPAALSAAAAALNQGSCPVKKIVLITDGQRVGWEIDQPERWKFVGDTFARMNPTPDLVLRKIPAPARFRNAGVAAIEFSRDAVGIDRDIGINVRVENTGTEAVTPTDLKLRIDADILTDRTIGQIEPGASETIRFSYRFKQEGSRVLTAQLGVKDDLASDDACSAALHVIGTLRVLLVDGNPSSRFLEGAAAFAALAMAPADAPGAGTGGGGRPEDAAADRFLIEPRIVDVMTLSDVGTLDRYDVVALAGVPRLPARFAEDLGAYVFNGGGLLLAPGENAQRDFYNTWGMGRGMRIPPANLGHRVTPKLGEEAKLALTTLEHRSIRPVRDNSRNDLNTVALSAYWQLNELSVDKAVSVGGRLNNGDPFLVERKLGKGLVLMTACSLDNRGGNLAGRSSFVPLVHELVYYLSNPARPNLAVQPGPNVALRLSARRPGTLADKDYPVDVAGPASLKLKGQFRIADDGMRVRMEGIYVPGVYRIAVPDALRDPCRALLAADGTIPFAVAPDVEENRLQLLSPADLDVVKRFTRLSVADSVDVARQILAGKTSGQELWRPLAVAALLILLAESVLTRWIASRRGVAPADASAAAAGK